MIEKLARVGMPVAVTIGALSLTAVAQTQKGSPSQIERGKYLVTFGGCTDCHTPGYFLGKPDNDRFLGGSDVGFEIPGLGIFAGRNLTPDKETGLGDWSVEQIITAMTKGKRPDGRELAPVMPWRAYANLTRQDMEAIALYLKSLKPVKNKVAGPFGPNEATIFVMKIVPGEAMPPAPAGQKK